MSVVKTIENLVRFGYEVKFSTEISQFVITLEKEGESKSQMLPLEDHVTEDRIIGCLDLLEDKFKK